MNDHMMNGKRWNALRTALLTAVAVMLVLSAVMGSAWAYFTTYARAKGGYPISLGHEEHDDEEFSNWEKTLRITVSEDSRPVYLRARAFYPGQYKLVIYDDNNNWQANGEWWYYTKLCPRAEEKDGKEVEVFNADPLHVKIEGVPADETEGAMVGDEFNVIIVYEAAEAQYDEKGNLLPCDDERVWKKKVTTQSVSSQLTETTESSASGSSEGGDE